MQLKSKLRSKLNSAYMSKGGRAAQSMNIIHQSYFKGDLLELMFILPERAPPLWMKWMSSDTIWLTHRCALTKLSWV